MKKAYRIKKEADILDVLRANKSRRNRFFKIYKKENHDNRHFRFAISVSKKFGKAHTRNKIKRQIRMLMTTYTINKTDDIFIIVNPEASDMAFKKMDEALRTLLIKLNIIEVTEQ